MRSNSDPEARSFDHNKAWQSQAVAESYDTRRFTSLGGSLFDRMEKRAIEECLRAAHRIQPIRSMLELACGTGRISEFLAGREYELTCADISNEMLAVAQQRLKRIGEQPVTFELLDIYKIAKPSEGFDCVSAFRLFQHLTSAERARALREMARVSRRFVLVNVMYTSRYYETVRALRKKLGRYTTRYTSSRAEIDHELEYAGLKISQSKFTQPGFNGNRVMLLEKA